MAQIPSMTVNPPENVPPALQPHVFRFEAALRRNGFAIATRRDTANLDLQLGFDRDSVSITIESELLSNGRSLVRTPVRNKAIFKDRAIPDTAVVAAERFSRALAYYVSSNRSRPPTTSPVSGSSQTGSPAVSSGTAFAVSSSGWFVTAYHVIDGADRITLTCGSDEAATAKAAKIDPANDLALLRAEVRPAATLALSADNSAKVGSHVFTMGYPTPELLGIEPKYTDGVISSLTGIQNFANLMQVTVPIQPGNSGGPLVDMDGRVVGLVTSSAAVAKFFAYTGTLPQNVNWAVRSEYIRPLIVGVLPTVAVEIPRGRVVEVVRDSLCLVEAVKY